MERHQFGLLKILSVFVFAIFNSGVVIGQSDLMEQAVALEEAWDEEQKVLAKITELGGWYKIGECLSDEMKDMVDPEKQTFVIEVNMVYNDDDGRVDNDNLSSEALKFIGRCTQVKRVFLKGTQANDEQMKHLVNLHQLETFFVWDAQDVSDVGMGNLSNLVKLKSLHISNSQISDAGIGSLVDCTEIEKLSLQGNLFTDKVFEHASKFKQLKTLWIGVGKGHLSDEGLEHLYNCDSLNTLDVQHSGISHDAVERLKEKVPGLTKVYNNQVVCFLLGVRQSKTCV